MISIPTLLVSGLKGKDILQKTIKIGGEIYHWAKHKSNTFEIGEPSDIADLFFNGRIDYGAFVIGQGYFSQFAHTYKPLSYMPQVAGLSTEKDLGFKLTEKGLRRLGKTTFTTVPFSLPIECLPNTLSHSGVIKLGFIYHSNFSGFIHENNPELENTIQNNPIGTILQKIPETAKPIPIIFRGEEHNKYLGRIIRFKARLIEIPSEYLEALTINLGEQSRMIFDLAYRPFNLGHKTLCLSLLDEKAELTQAPDISISHIRGSLFLESHLESFKTSLQFMEILPDAIPDTVNFPKAYNYPPYTNFQSFMTTGNVRVIYRDPGIVGFYIETDLRDPVKYQNDFTILRNYYRKTDRAIQSHCSANGLKRYKLKLDFLFDYHLKSQLDPRGILESDEVGQILTENPQLQETKKWLNSNE